MNWLLVFAVGGLLTFAMRFSFIYMLGRLQMPEALRRALRFVPAAVLSALIVPELVQHSDRLDLSAGNTRLIAGVVAIVIAWWTRNMLATILAGFAVLLALEWVF